MTSDLIINKNPKNNKFTFTKRSIEIDNCRDLEILATKVGGNHILFIFYSDFSLRKVHLIDGKTEFVKSLDPEAFTSTSNFNLHCSKDNEFVAITWNRVCVGTKVSLGVVLNTKNGDVELHLNNGYYYTDMAPFPVCFFNYKEKNLIVHATDWNKLDVTDIESGEVLTHRDLNQYPEPLKDSDYGHTEWPSLLLASPSEDQLAVQGWMWHPAGILYSFNLKNWLEHNIWESDLIPTKNIYTSMYDWCNPFCWINDTKICICEVGFQNNEPEKTSVYNTETGECLLEFFGPTLNVFFFDDYLFSGLSKDNSYIEGLSVWSLEDGTLLHQEDSFPTIHDYNINSKEFISFQAEGRIELIQWTKAY